MTTDFRPRLAKCNEDEIENKEIGQALEMRISKTKDEESIGYACRIRYFYVNKF